MIAFTQACVCGCVCVCGVCGRARDGAGACNVLCITHALTAQRRRVHKSLASPRARLACAYAYERRIYVYSNLIVCAGVCEYVCVFHYAADAVATTPTVKRHKWMISMCERHFVACVCACVCAERTICRVWGRIFRSSMFDECGATSEECIN